ncbi:hypothetical protein EFA69_10590 [Rufibacter immobilis]|uniref:Lipoprotein n=1 Tax=Rufibacter immobilis TaxID=1348778 RepID=A0A3M9MWR5_9BACT|nr:hypothetical protein [Rufibacter immobilis]RNI29966.1 hypothetical protein EFA69_10590 [Rufibacter immobilis]
MKTVLLVSSFLLCLLAGCQSNSSKPETRQRVQATSKEQQRQLAVLEKDTLNAVQEENVRKPGLALTFETVFQRFKDAVENQDTATFQTYVDPALGLYLIDAPGAVPQFTHVAHINQYRRPVQQKPFFSIRETFRDCALQEVTALPKVTCAGDADAYAQRGCFVADATSFRKSEAYLHANLSSTERDKIARTLPLVTKTVLHTTSGFKFHFGQVNGQWRILFIDLMVPCNA